jgi:hypothetical protein
VWSLLDRRTPQHARRDERPRAAKPTTRTRVSPEKVYRLGDLDAINSFTHSDSSCSRASGCRPRPVLRFSNTILVLPPLVSQSCIHVTAQRLASHQRRLQLPYVNALPGQTEQEDIDARTVHDANMAGCSFVVLGLDLVGAVVRRAPTESCPTRTSPKRCRASRVSSSTVSSVKANAFLCGACRPGTSLASIRSRLQISDFRRPDVVG